MNIYEQLNHILNLDEVYLDLLIKTETQTWFCYAMKQSI